MPTAERPAWAEGSFEDIEEYGRGRWWDELTEELRADLSGYFDSIPHPELMRCVARRVSDQAMLHLIKQWLVAPVEETDERGHVYFCYGTYTPAFQIVHGHACRRVRRWLRRKFKVKGQGYRQYPDSYLERELGLLNVTRFPRRYSWAKS